MAENKEVAERVRPIIIRDAEHNKEYTLEFNRDTIKFAEQRGFMLADVDRFPMTKLPEFFWYAFRMHHPSVSLNQAEKLLERMGGINDAVGRRLGELWAIPYEALNPTDGDEKNVSVTVEL